MLCHLQAIESGKEYNFQLEHARIIITSCNEIQLFRLTVEHVLPNGTEEREGGYYENIVLRYHATENRCDVAASNSPTIPYINLNRKD